VSNFENLLSDSLSKLCEHFRHSVMDAVALQPPHSLMHFQGLYLFYVNQFPSFYLEILPEGSNSGTTERFNGESLARVTIHTDEKTLERLLNGTMKAKLAFLSGKVKLSGDVPSFLKLVSFLKSQGVRP
jgi:hypothetical protein